MDSSTVPPLSDVSDTELANGADVEPNVQLTRNEKKNLIAETCESVVVNPEG